MRKVLHIILKLTLVAFLNSVVENYINDLHRFYYRMYCWLLTYKLPEKNRTLLVSCTILIYSSHTHTLTWSIKAVQYKSRLNCCARSSYFAFYKSYSVNYTYSVCCTASYSSDRASYSDSTSENYNKLIVVLITIYN